MNSRNFLIIPIIGSLLAYGYHLNAMNNISDITRGTIEQAVKDKNIAYLKNSLITLLKTPNTNKIMWFDRFLWLTVEISVPYKFDQDDNDMLTSFVENIYMPLVDLKSGASSSYLTKGISFLIGHGADIEKVSDENWKTILGIILSSSLWQSETFLKYRPITTTTRDYLDVRVQMTHLLDEGEKDKVRGLLRSAARIDDTRQPATSSIPSFNRSKTLLASLMAAITGTVVYKLFIGKTESGEKQNVLINNTGKPIFVMKNDIQDTQVDVNQTFQLPETGAVKIKMILDQEDADLEIDLTQYADKRADNYLNLIISKNWFTWLFGPLSYSVRWVPKQKAK